MVAASLSSGFGVWNPLIWLLVFAIGCIIAYVVWRSGVSGFRKGTGQGRPYLSGNEEPAKGDVHIRAGNLYWGFTEGIKGYYQQVVPLHTGILTDYLLWMFCVAGVLLVIVMVI
jgi:hypothetical protein